MTHCPPCTMNYSRGGGDGVAEALGNWGFSNEVASPGHELERVQCLLERMDALRIETKCPQKKPPPEVCVFDHSPPECRPSWMFWEKSPLLVYKQVRDTLLTSDKRLVRTDRMNPVPERGYALQGNDKWYKLGPLCCPQPSCPVPACPIIEKRYCCNNFCM